eukprot:TRINITY_DN5601_c0_g1_i2.p1 TRINITY_DN5601_c0_g1~~TRINITY_DN5601_c0_g1_i2.p1  ORF type:complete len:763 (+),score=186.20 TRINITY_DN5601_c0_g1_i2:95-2290(+)
MPVVGTAAGTLGDGALAQAQCAAAVSPLRSAAAGDPQRQMHPGRAPRSPEVDAAAARLLAAAERYRPRESPPLRSGALPGAAALHAAAAGAAAAEAQQAVQDSVRRRLLDAATADREVAACYAAQETEMLRQLASRAERAYSPPPPPSPPPRPLPPPPPPESPPPLAAQRGPWRRETDRLAVEWELERELRRGRHAAGWDVDSAARSARLAVGRESAALRSAAQRSQLRLEQQLRLESVTAARLQQQQRRGILSPPLDSLGGGGSPPADCAALAEQPHPAELPAAPSPQRPAAAPPPPAPELPSAPQPSGRCASVSPAGPAPVPTPHPTPVPAHPPLVPTSPPSASPAPQAVARLPAEASRDARQRMAEAVGELAMSSPGEMARQRAPRPAVASPRAAQPRPQPLLPSSPPKVPLPPPPMPRNVTPTGLLGAPLPAPAPRASEPRQQQLHQQQQQQQQQRGGGDSGPPPHRTRQGAAAARAAGRARTPPARQPRRAPAGDSEGERRRSPGSGRQDATVAATAVSWPRQLRPHLQPRQRPAGGKLRWCPPRIASPPAPGPAPAAARRSSSQSAAAPPSPAPKRRPLPPPPAPPPGRGQRAPQTPPPQLSPKERRAEAELLFSALRKTDVSTDQFDVRCSHAPRIGTPRGPRAVNRFTAPVGWAAETYHLASPSVSAQARQRGQSHDQLWLLCRRAGRRAVTPPARSTRPPQPAAPPQRAGVSPPRRAVVPAG